MFAQIGQRWRHSGLGRAFHARDKNEQRIILVLAVLVIVSLLWVVLWKPVSDWRAIETNRQTNAQQLLDWINGNEAAIRAAGRNANANQTGRALIPLITKAADAHELKLNRLQPESNGVISVVLQQQSFNKIVSWIAQLRENNGVTVQRASFDGADAPGYVNAQIRLH